MFGKLTLAALFVGVGISLFSYTAMKECENFTIPDQTGKVMIVTGGNSGTVRTANLSRNVII
jgi:hypothetical protein